MTTRTLNLTLARAGPLDVTADDRGAGRPFLLLHGGGGPQTVAGFAELLATHVPARVITPSHPGFGGTLRPDGLTSMAGLAALYRELLDRLGLDDVTVIGNSIGGWIAAELALLGSPRISGLVLADPALRGRLAAIACPTLVVWGEADRIADPDYGRAYAAAIPGARFELLQGTGHLPQLETPEQLMRAVWDFAEAPAAR